MRVIRLVVLCAALMATALAMEADSGAEFGASATAKPMCSLPNSAFPPGAEVFDYVVVGSGAGGAVVASKLAVAGHRVCLMEAGGDDTNPHTVTPAFHALSSEDNLFSWKYFTRHYSTNQQRDSKYVAAKSGIFYPRAGTLGGCTAHLALVTIYPHNSDWDGLAAATGDYNWSAKNMRKTYWTRVEKCEYRSRFLNLVESGGHGFSGWLHTHQADIGIVLKALDPKFIDTLGIPLLSGGWINSAFDPNSADVADDHKEGFHLMPIATDGKSRSNPRSLIASTLQNYPGKLTVRTHSFVTKVLWGKGTSAPTAIGVEYIPQARIYAADPATWGKTSDSKSMPRKSVYASREVILSGGAFETPKLLMLSGVGPAETLSKFKIPVVKALEGVGKNMQDRYEVGIVHETNSDWNVLKDCPFLPDATKDKCYADWSQKGSGVYTTNGVLLGIIKKSDPKLVDPDLYIFGVPGYFKGYYPDYSALAGVQKNYFSWLILKGHTKNTAGVVTLASTDPIAVPDINFHYHEEGNDPTLSDAEAVAKGIEYVRSLSDKMKITIKQEIVPGRAKAPDHASLVKFVKDESWGHHACCTSKMGMASDPTAVVDGQFRVLGTSRLRVVDASIFPHIPGFFLVVPTYMAGEKAADDIHADALNSVCPPGAPHPPPEPLSANHKPKSKLRKLRRETAN